MRQNCKCVSFTASEQSENELLSIMTETVLTELAPDMIGMVKFSSFEKLFGFIGNKAMDDISYPLKMLQKSEIIEKRMASKPYYILNDSMLVFWFKYVNRALSLINVGRGEKYYHNSVSDKLHDFMGNVFEKMCKDFLLMNAGEVLLLTIEDLYS